MLSVSGVQLIVGLGNPGPPYQHTRHNAGAWLVQSIADQANVSLRPQAKFHGLHSFLQLHHYDCHLLLPTTFMNHSGQSVQALMTWYKITPQSILVCHDEIDLPVGTVRLKFEGGHGGHNGLRDIIQQLGSRQFYRLRIGVGRPADDQEVVDYVLQAPSNAERDSIEEGLGKALEFMPLLLAGEYQKALQQLHS